jgi:hypothetical protein
MHFQQKTWLIALVHTCLVFVIAQHDEILVNTYQPISTKIRTIVNHDSNKLALFYAQDMICQPVAIPAFDEWTSCTKPRCLNVLAWELTCGNYSWSVPRIHDEPIHPRIVHKARKFYKSECSATAITKRECKPLSIS